MTTLMRATVFIFSSFYFLTARHIRSFTSILTGGKPPTVDSAPKIDNHRSFADAEADAVALVERLCGFGRVVVGIDALEMPLTFPRKWYGKKTVGDGKNASLNKVMVVIVKLSSAHSVSPIPMDAFEDWIAAMDATGFQAL